MMATICSGGQVERRSGPASGRRSEDAPLRGFIESIGAIVLLFRRTVVSALTLPSNYEPELVDQFLFALRPGSFPMILATLAFTYERAGIEVGNFLNHYPDSHKITMRYTATTATGRLLGVQLVGHLRSEIAKRIDVPATAIFNEMTIDALSDLDLSYTPPLGSPWDAPQGRSSSVDATSTHKHSDPLPLPVMRPGSAGKRPVAEDAPRYDESVGLRTAPSTRARPGRSPVAAAGALTSAEATA